VRQDGEGGCVQLGQAVAQVLVGELVGVRRTLELDLMAGQSAVVAVGARLLVLEGLAAAFDSLVVDLQGATSAPACNTRETNPPLRPLAS
jgi:hypothetical protein